MKATSAIEPPVRPQPLRKSLLIGLYRRVTVTLYETPSCATGFLRPVERRRWLGLRASLSQACRTTSPC